MRAVCVISLVCCLMIGPEAARGEISEAFAPEAMLEFVIPIAQIDEQATKVSPLMEQIKRERLASRQAGSSLSPSANPLQALVSKNVMYFFLFVGAGLFLLKKTQQQKQPLSHPNAIQVIARQALGSKTALLIVDAEGERFLLSQTADEVHLISQLELSQLSRHENVKNFDASENLGTLAELRAAGVN